MAAKFLLDLTIAKVLPVVKVPTQKGSLRNGSEAPVNVAPPLILPAHWQAWLSCKRSGLPFAECANCATNLFNILRGIEIGDFR